MYKNESIMDIGYFYVPYLDLEGESEFSPFIPKIEDEFKEKDEFLKRIEDQNEEFIKDSLT